MTGPVKVKCRNCGREAIAEEFKLHYKLRMMVCPICYKGKTDSSSDQLSPPPSIKNTEDESMRRIAHLKQQPASASYREIPNSDQVRYRCTSCRYTFKHDPYRNHPASCPYCDAKVPWIKTY